MKKIAFIGILIAVLVGMVFGGLSLASAAPQATPTPAPTSTPAPVPTPTPTPTPTPAQASLTISPSSGPPGTAVTLVGSGFCAYASIPAGNIIIAGVPWNPVTIQANATGDWIASLMIPSNLASGPCPVTATSAGNCILLARATFTVTPTCGCLPAGFHADYAFRQQSTGQIRDTGIDASSNPPPTSPGGWDVIQILVKE